MIVLRIKDLVGRAKFLTGASLGQSHLAQIIESLLPRLGEADQAVIILDFEGIEFISASYFKACVLGLAKEFVKHPTLSHVALFPVVHNLSDEHREELALLCRGENFPCQEVIKFGQNKLLSGRMFGDLDNTFKRSLQLLQNTNPASAADLAENAPTEQINVTAWNNRLAELFRLRLATRFKDGRFWKYEPVVKETIYG